jgi:hypothetical protein
MAGYGARDFKPRRAVPGRLIRAPGAEEPVGIASGFAQRSGLSRHIRRRALWQLTMRIRQVSARIKGAMPILNDFEAEIKFT